MNELKKQIERALPLMQELEIIEEFLVESNENLQRLDREMVELEGRPSDADLLASIFRTVHTIKGTCGFLNFTTLEKITHQIENLLSQLRNGERSLTQELVSIILETVDAVKTELTSIEATSKESGTGHEDLLRRQQLVMNQVDSVEDPLPAAVSEQNQPAFTESPAVFDAPAPSDEGAPLEIPDNRWSTDGPRGASVANSRIRVDVALLNRLMNLVGELVLARNQILQFNSRQEDPALNATAQTLNLITTELQEGVMKTRMQPIGIVWRSLPRVVRDLATACGKQITLEVQGAETELDKTIIEAIKDPITHLVRNACDHGIETTESRVRAKKAPHGTLTLRAFHEGGNVNIEISDDGAGIDPRKIKASALKKSLITPEYAERLTDREITNLIFRPGFSTAKELSSISGRGVGMDVVKTNIEKIGGTVDLSSKPGAGTAVKIKIPLTLAIIPGLVVTSAGERFVIPQANLLELIRLEGAAAKAQIEQIHGALVYRRRGNLIPLANLDSVLGLPSRPLAESEVANIIIVQAEDRQFGLIVDRIEDTQEIVVKPLGCLLKHLRCYAGATIMGDGKVSLILDVLGVAQLSGFLSELRDQASDQSSGTTAHTRDDRQALLLFRAGTFERLAVPLSLVARLEEFPLSRIEQAAGGMVVQYRGQILPLIPLAAQLGCPTRPAPLQDPVLVVVFADGERRIGIVVDQIIDIVEDSVSVKKSTARSGLLGSAVVGGRVTDFLDLPLITQEAEQDWFRQSSTPSGGITVLLTEASPFARSLVRSYLEIAGHRVIEAATPDEAIEKLGKDAVNVVMTSLDLPNRGAFELLKSIRSQATNSGIPVVGLSGSPEDCVIASTGPGSFCDCFCRFDRMAMLGSLARLAKAVSFSEAPMAQAAEKQR